MKFLYNTLFDLSILKINSNILETGILNIATLIVSLIFFGEPLCKNIVKEKKTNVKKNIKEVKRQLISATKCFEEKKRNSLGLRK